MAKLEFGFDHASVKDLKSALKRIDQIAYTSKWILCKNLALEQSI